MGLYSYVLNNPLRFVNADGHEADMARGLVRYQNSGNMHFITFSCYRRQQFFGSPMARDLFEHSLDQGRVHYDFFVTRYFVMTEHVHVLVSEPKKAFLRVAI